MELCISNFAEKLSASRGKGAPMQYATQGELFEYNSMLSCHSYTVQVMKRMKCLKFDAGVLQSLEFSVILETSSYWFLCNFLHIYIYVLDTRLKCCGSFIFTTGNSIAGISQEIVIVIIIITIINSCQSSFIINDR